MLAKKMVSRQVGVDGRLATNYFGFITGSLKHAVIGLGVLGIVPHQQIDLGYLFLIYYFSILAYALDKSFWFK